MTREELVETLKAMREAAARAEAAVVACDLEAKRAASRDPDLADVAAAHADELRASLDAVAARAGFVGKLLAHAAKGDPR